MPTDRALLGVTEACRVVVVCGVLNSESTTELGGRGVTRSIKFRSLGVGVGGVATLVVSDSSENFAHPATLLLDAVVDTKGVDTCITLPPSGTRLPGGVEPYALPCLALYPYL